MKKVLLTGFEPFGGESINPALEVIKELAKEEIKNLEIITLQLPVVFRKAYEILIKNISEHSPDLILSIGQSGGSSAIAIEKIGINIKNAKLPDNEGNKPYNEQIVEEGPAAYFTTIDVNKSVINLKNAGIPAIISYSAGTYVCNDLIFGVLHYIYTTNNIRKYGFIHVPYLPKQVATKKQVAPSMSLSIIKEAVSILITTNLEEK